MKAAVQRVFIFTLAIGTHQKGVHGGPVPVIGNIFNNGETRAAIGAVGEGVTETPVRWVKYLSPAVGAGGQVGGDHLVLACLSHAWPDLESHITDHGQLS